MDKIYLDQEGYKNYLKEIEVIKEKIQKNSIDISEYIGDDAYGDGWHDNFAYEQAIKKENCLSINEERCIGCGQCKDVCPISAISFYSKLENYEKFLPEIIEKKIDCIEFHAISTDEKDVDEKWQQINKMFSGMLCISLDRSELGDKRLLDRVKRLIKDRKPYTTIIQADGIAMSGNNDEYGTTLQAVATSQLFQNAKLPVYIMMSGGTNTKSTQLAKLCDVKPHCIAVGSYARKIVKNYLEIENLLDNQTALDEAIFIAKSLIDVSLENMIND